MVLNECMNLHVGKALCEGKKWYFYSRRTPNRITESGYWQSIGVEEAIYSSTAAHKVGIKKHSAFYIGDPSQGVQTNWIMHEYKVPNSSSSRKKNFKNNIVSTNSIYIYVYMELMY